MGSKNNPKNRSGAKAGKTLNGKEVEPILFVGNTKEEGKYVSAKYAKTSDVILDETTKKPVRWDKINNDKIED